MVVSFDLGDVFTLQSDSSIGYCRSTDLNDWNTQFASTNTLTRQTVAIIEGDWENFCPINPLSTRGLEELRDNLNDVWDTDDDVAVKMAKTNIILIGYTAAVTMQIATYAQEALIHIGALPSHAAVRISQHMMKVQEDFWFATGGSTNPLSWR